MSDDDIWWVRYVPYTTRGFKTPSGCAKAVARFSKGREVESVSFNRHLDETGQFTWTATIVVDE